MLLGLLKAHILYPLVQWQQKRSILPRLRVLRQESSAPFEARRRRLRQQLAATLSHAGATVPYYRDLFASLGFNPHKMLEDERHIEALPYLTKDIVREQGARMLSESCNPAALHERKTGSSTGPATLFHYDQAGLDWTAAENILVLEWGGKKRHQHEAHLSTRFPEPLPEAAARREACKCFVLNRTNIYTSDFSDAGLKPVWQALRAARARMVQGHPSTLYALAGYVQRCDIDAQGAFAIFESTGEMLAHRQRERIEQAFACRVINRYGAAEFGVMAHESQSGPKGELRVMDSLVYPELRPLGPDEMAADSREPCGQPEEASPPGTGELVFTGVRNWAMPLIRYRMGDMGTLVERPSGWWLTNLTGRVHDIVRLGDKTYPTHFIQDVLDRCQGLENMQIVVSNASVQEVRLVVPDAAAQERVLASFANSFPGVPCTIISPSELVFAGWRSKFRYILETESLTK